MNLSEIGGGVMTTVYETGGTISSRSDRRALSRMCPLMEGR